MREIKFRAWDIENKYFVNSNRYFIELDDGTTWFNLGTDEGSDNLVDQSFKLELMQYTGLKDKNGKEIYHKDFIRSARTGLLYHVEWDNESAAWEALCVDREKDYSIGPYLWCNNEIEGNSLESPELLEES